MSSYKNEGEIACYARLQKSLTSLYKAFESALCLPVELSVMQSGNSSWAHPLPTLSLHQPLGAWSAHPPKLFVIIHYLIN